MPKDDLDSGGAAFATQQRDQKKPAAPAKRANAGLAPKPKRDPGRYAEPPANQTHPPSFSANAAAPPIFDFGKVAPGTRQSVSIPIYNLSPTPVAAMRVSYHGDPAIHLRSSPGRLDGAGNPLTAAQSVTLEFLAPATRGTHTGRVTIHLIWVGGGPASETLSVPVVAHAMEEWQPTPEEETATKERERREQQEVAANAAGHARAQRDLGAFDAKHPSFVHAGFNTATQKLYAAMEGLENLQLSGLDLAREEVMAYRKAPPRTEPTLMFELAMLVLDIASASVAGKIAKTLEAALRDPIAEVSATVGGRLVTATIAETGKALAHPSKLTAPNAALITDAVKEALKGSGKLARKQLAATFAGPAGNQGDSADPRIAFFGAARKGIILTALHRKIGVIDATALLRPLLFRDAQQAELVVERMAIAINQEIAHASETYAMEARQQWVSFIARPHLDRNTVAGAGDYGIGEARGVLDIGFQAGRSPRDPVTVRTAILRGVSNKLAVHFWKDPAINARIPVRAYGMPSPGHAELLVTVLREADGTLRVLDDSHGAAPGPGRWLARKGDGDVMAGATRLLEQEILHRSLFDHGVGVTTDQDPAVEQETGL